jgi:hypothetical protein
MDECQNCTMRGNLAGCLETPCNHHSSWMAQQLRQDGARLLWLIRDAGIDGWAGSARDRYDVAQEVAAQAGREEANDSDELTAIRMLIDSTRA